MDHSAAERRRGASATPAAAAAGAAAAAAAAGATAAAAESAGGSASYTFGRGYAAEAKANDACTTPQVKALVVDLQQIRNLHRNWLLYAQLQGGSGAGMGPMV